MDVRRSALEKSKLTYLQNFMISIVCLILYIPAMPQTSCTNDMNKWDGLYR